MKDYLGATRRRCDPHLVLATQEICIRFRAMLKRCTAPIHRQKNTDPSCYALKVLS